LVRRGPDRCGARILTGRRPARGMLPRSASVWGALPVGPAAPRAPVGAPGSCEGGGGALVRADQIALRSSAVGARPRGSRAGRPSTQTASRVLGAGHLPPPTPPGRGGPIETFQSPSGRPSLPGGPSAFRRGIAADPAAERPAERA
jgi:hypothetical protein